MMERRALTDFIRMEKSLRKLTWEDIGAKMGLSPIFIASVCLGQNCLTDEKAAKNLMEILGLPLGAKETLLKPPIKGQDGDSLFKDPLIARLHEVNVIYGLSLKEVIEEKFGAGIMSAIDFTLDVEKVENPLGDRVKITMCGKFLPYKQF